MGRGTCFWQWGCIHCVFIYWELLVPSMIWDFIYLKELKTRFSSFKWNDIVIITLPTPCCVLQVLRDKALPYPHQRKRSPEMGRNFPKHSQEHNSHPGSSQSRAEGVWAASGIMAPFHKILPGSEGSWAILSSSSHRTKCNLHQVQPQLKMFLKKGKSWKK